MANNRTFQQLLETKFHDQEYFGNTCAATVAENNLLLGFNRLRDRETSAFRRFGHVERQRDADWVEHNVIAALMELDGENRRPV